MKYCWLVALVFSSALAQADAIRLSEPVASDAQSETFGAPLEVDNPLALSMVMADTDAHVGKTLQIQARVAQVCQKKGCFFVAQDGAAAVRVTFKDYGFFVPTDSSGKMATLMGELVQRHLSAEDAAHLSADVGDEVAVNEGVTYEFVASAIRLAR